MLKVGVLGAGHLGKIHLRLLQQSDKYELVGFYDENQENAERISKEFGYKNFSTIAKLIHAVDVIDIVTPTLSHYKCAKVAIKSGKLYKRRNIFLKITYKKTMNKRVVITGMGIYSCIGTSLDEVKESLYNGKSGIQFDPERKEFGFQSALTGIVPKTDLKSLLTRRQRMSIGEETEYAYMATIEALKNANIDDAFFDDREVGIMYGNDSVSKAIIDATDIVREKKDTALIGSGAIFKSMNSTVTMNLSTIFKLRGINLTISAACASGSHSIGLAYFLIKSGFQDIIICGGAQEINKYAMCSFDGLGVFSAREGEPQKASRPFDADRDGLIPSGGGATLILESYESAIA
ncbi:beta-ketoacyl synthase N-terminal-like domain-containing protein, partial [Flavobacterium sp. LBUM151]